MRRAGRLVVLVASLASCAPSQGEVPIAMLDRNEFATRVQPILAERCANPSCHGRPDRPLSLYAPLRHREDPNRVFLDEPLTDAELRHNWAASCAQGEALAQKPFGEPGGSYHGGGVVFDGPTDEGYRTLRAWLDGARR